MVRARVNHHEWQTNSSNIQRYLNMKELHVVNACMAIIRSSRVLSTNMQAPGRMEGGPCSSHIRKLDFKY